MYVYIYIYVYKIFVKYIHNLKTYVYGVFINAGYPDSWMVDFIEHPIQMDDLGVFRVLDTSIIAHVISYHVVL